jgi:hypothetical protein
VDRRPRERMGYACPVCETPQADAEHLANHLAFTAVLGDADHERWLDEAVPDWADRDPEGLGAAVAELAPEAEDPRVFDAGSGTSAPGEGEHEHGHEHDRGHGRDGGPRGVPFAAEDPELDGDAEEVIAEARELTARMRGDEREE